MVKFNHLKLAPYRNYEKIMLNLIIFSYRPEIHKTKLNIPDSDMILYLKTMTKFLCYLTTPYENLFTGIL